MKVAGMKEGRREGEANGHESGMTDMLCTNAFSDLLYLYIYTPPNDVMVLMLGFLCYHQVFFCLNAFLGVCCLCVNDMCIHDFKLKLVI